MCLELAVDHDRIGKKPCRESHLEFRGEHRILQLCIILPSVMCPDAMRCGAMPEDEGTKRKRGKVLALAVAGNRS
jgi:hypothetical protein